MPSSGNATVTYLEQDRFVGSREVYCCGYAPTSGVTVSAYWPHTAYFCPRCGSLWGRAIYDYHFDYAPIPKGSWAIESRPCVRCGDGQFLYGHDSLEGVSPELLTRELLALIEGAANGNFRSSQA